MKRSRSRRKNSTWSRSRSKVDRLRNTATLRHKESRTTQSAQFPISVVFVGFWAIQRLPLFATNLSLTSPLPVRVGWYLLHWEEFKNTKHSNSNLFFRFFVKFFFSFISDFFSFIIVMCGIFSSFCLQLILCRCFSVRLYRFHLTYV